MNLEFIVGELKLDVRCGEDKLGRKVRGGYVGDLLSDVIGNSSEGDIWVTRQAHQNIVAVASLKDHTGIILVNGSEPDSDTLEKAIKEEIPIMVSELPGFEVVGKIYKLMHT
ncbi:MAG: serine kinase [Proteobacteria bacterium]|nr:serine kinase [Pseudomonadota bacterium]